MVGCAASNAEESKAGRAGAGRTGVAQGWKMWIHPTGEVTASSTSDSCSYSFDFALLVFDASVSYSPSTPPSPYSSYKSSTRMSTSPVAAMPLAGPFPLLPPRLLPDCKVAPPPPPPRQAKPKVPNSTPPPSMGRGVGWKAAAARRSGVRRMANWWMGPRLSSAKKRCTHSGLPVERSRQRTSPVAVPAKRRKVPAKSRQVMWWWSGKVYWPTISPESKDQSLIIESAPPDARYMLSLAKQSTSS
mmetsp:Transcript_25118/g.45530  ORF Transcript_25118/g.45530 Transcript_25118/m.45530 type:complete len:245 (-) Transcript_25118:227-961(-)